MSQPRKANVNDPRTLILSCLFRGPTRSAESPDLAGFQTARAFQTTDANLAHAVVTGRENVRLTRRTSPANASIPLRLLPHDQIRGHNRPAAKQKTTTTCRSYSIDTGDQRNWQLRPDQPRRHFANTADVKPRRTVGRRHRRRIRAFF